jgi:hypothetical protein
VADDLGARIRAAELEARRRDASAREKGVRGFEEAAPVPVDRRDMPLRPSATGAALRFDGEARCFRLEGEAIANGDTVEVYTNAVNGWLRGRFSWSGRDEDPPRLVVNCWDANGVPDADGRPPFVGELVTAIPMRAVVRGGGSVSLTPWTVGGHATRG